MRLCNPDSLIEWRKVEPPRFKKDWPGRLVQAASVPHYNPAPPHAVPDMAVCEITRRDNYQSAMFELTLSWHCPACGHAHERRVPESWLDEGKLWFVENVGLADATWALDDHPAVLCVVTSYHHPEAPKRAARADIASQCAAWFARSGWRVMCPVAMRHAACSADRGLPTDYPSWQEVSLRMLETCDALVVLLLDGMRESEGVADAIAHARKLGIPLNQVRMAASDDAPQPFELAAQPRWWI